MDWFTCYTATFFTPAVAVTVEAAPVAGASTLRLAKGCHWEVSTKSSATVIMSAASVMIAVLATA